MSPQWERWIKHWQVTGSGRVWTVDWPADDDGDGAGARSRTEYAEPSTPVAASGDCAPATVVVSYDLYGDGPIVAALKSQIAALHLKIAQLEDEHKEQIRKLCAAAAKPTVIEEAPAFPVNALKWSA